MTNGGFGPEHVDHSDARDCFHSKGLWEAPAVELDLGAKALGVEGQPGLAKVACIVVPWLTGHIPRP